MMPMGLQPRTSADAVCYCPTARPRVGTDTKPDKAMLGAGHWMHHYWGKIAGAKAWEGKRWTEPAHLLRGQCSGRLGTNLQYLSRLKPTPRNTSCAPRLREMAALRRSAEAHPEAVAAEPSGEGRGCIEYMPPRVPLW